MVPELMDKSITMPATRLELSNITVLERSNDARIIKTNYGVVCRFKNNYYLVESDNKPTDEIFNILCDIKNVEYVDVLVCGFNATRIDTIHFCCKENK